MVLEQIMAQVILLHMLVEQVLPSMLYGSKKGFQIVTM